MNKEVNNVLNQYVLVRNAKNFIHDRIPVIEKILAHSKDDRLTVCALGEEIMGKEAYHQKYVWHNGKEASFRINEARALTGYITQALRKLCAMGVLTRHEEVDESKFIEFETEDYYYTDANGNKLPDSMEVTLADGRRITISPNSIPGAQRKWGKFMRKVHPKISYYTFN